MSLEGGGIEPPERSPMNHRYRCGADTVELAMERLTDGWSVETPDGRKWRLRSLSVTDGMVRLCTVAEDGIERWIEMPVRRIAGTIELAWHGSVWRFAPAAAGDDPAAASGVLLAPMVGVVAEVRARAGDVVARGQPIATIEAMKIIAPVNAPFAGKVVSIRVQKGDRVEMGAVLAEIQPEGDPA